MADANSSGGLTEKTVAVPFCLVDTEESLEFKQETMKLVDGRRASDPSKLARDFGITPNLMQRWEQEL
jgi:hypothetical protein